MINELLKDHDRDTEFLVIASLRYCIGRRTYAPSLVTDWVMRHWDKIVSRGLIDGMAQELFYKDIYKLVKKRVITLADMY